MKPLDPRLLKRAKATGWYLASLVVLALLSVASTIAIAWNLASFVVAVFTQDQELYSALDLLGFALLFAAIRAGFHFLQELLGSQISQRVKLELRDRALDAIDSGVKPEGIGSWSYLLGPGLDSLDVYFSKFIPQLVFTALVTPIWVALLIWLDLPSGLVLVFTLPLIPLFMILIGLVTSDVQRRQLESLEKLNNHFYEVLRGILTLKIFNRVDRQSAVLSKVAMQHREKTLKVLRVSFLSGFALELAASLSVALIAVTIGIRLIDGELDLLTGLFVLLIAPEAYLPLRQVGIQFHASSDAVSISSRVLDLIESKPEPDRIGVALPTEGFVAVVGKSGSGKSTSLDRYRNRGAWMPQRTVLIPGSLIENVLMFQPQDYAALEWTMRLAQLEDLDPEIQLGERSPLSGGQVQRIGFARAVYRAVTGQSGLLVLDEPFSQQNPELVAKLCQSLEALRAAGIAILVATHQQQIIDLSERVVRID